MVYEIQMVTRLKWLPCILELWEGGGYSTSMYVVNVSFNYIVDERTHQVR